MPDEKTYKFSFTKPSYKRYEAEEDTDSTDVVSKVVDEIRPNLGIPESKDVGYSPNVSRFGGVIPPDEPKLPVLTTERSKSTYNKILSFLKPSLGTVYDPFNDTYGRVQNEIDKVMPEFLKGHTANLNLPKTPQLRQGKFPQVKPQVEDVYSKFVNEKFPLDVKASLMGKPEESNITPEVSSRAYADLVKTRFPKEPTYLKQKLIEMISPASQVNEGLGEIFSNPIAGGLKTVTGIGNTLLSPISTGFSIMTDMLNEVPSVQVSKDISLGGKELANAINLPFEILGLIPVKGAEYLDKVTGLPDNQKIADAIGVDRKTIDDITQSTQDFNVLASTLVGLKIAHSTQGKLLKKEPTLQEAMALGDKALRTALKKGAISPFVNPGSKIQLGQYENVTWRDIPEIVKQVPNWQNIKHPIKAWSKEAPKIEKVPVRTEEVSKEKITPTILNQLRGKENASIEGIKQKGNGEELPRTPARTTVPENIEQIRQGQGGGTNAGNRSEVGRKVKQNVQVPEGQKNEKAPEVSENADELRYKATREKLLGGKVKKNWREVFDETQDISRKTDILRGIAGISKTNKELSDILDRAKDLPDEGNIYNDVALNPSASPKVKQRAKSLYKKYFKPTEGIKQPQIDVKKEQAELQKMLEEEKTVPPSGNQAAIQRMTKQGKSPEDISKALNVPIKEVQNEIGKTTKPVTEEIKPPEETKREAQVGETVKGTTGLERILDKNSKLFQDLLGGKTGKDLEKLTTDEEKLRDKFFEYTNKPEVRKKYESGAKDSEIINDFYKENPDLQKALIKPEVPKSNFYIDIQGKRFGAGSLKEISDKYNEAIKRSDIGGEEAYGKGFANNLVYDKEGKQIGYISYNGKIWKGKPGEEHNESTDLLYGEPYKSKPSNNLETQIKNYKEGKPYINQEDVVEKFTNADGVVFEKRKSLINGEIAYYAKVNERSGWGETNKKYFEEEKKTSKPFPSSSLSEQGKKAGRGNALTPSGDKIRFDSFWSVGGRLFEAKEGQYYRLSPNEKSMELVDEKTGNVVGKRFPRSKVKIWNYKEGYEDRAGQKPIEKVENKPIPSQGKEQTAETWQEAVLRYLVNGGKVRDAAEEYNPKRLRELGLSNRNISPNGTPIDKLISELGFSDLSYKNDFEESRLVRDLLYKYDTHEKRVQALKDLRGELPEEIARENRVKQKQYEKLDDIILNEYLDNDGNLRTNEILKNSDRITQESNIDNDVLLAYLREREKTEFKPDDFDDVFGEIFKKEDIDNETAKKVITESSPAELKKSAEDIESKAESSKEADLNEAISKADELISPPSPQQQQTFENGNRVTNSKTGESGVVTEYNVDLPGYQDYARVKFDNGKEKYVKKDRLTEEVFNLTSEETGKTKKQKPEQLGFEGMGKPSFKKSEDYLKPKGKEEETTPLFQQKFEAEGQEKLFEGEQAKSESLPSPEPVKAKENFDIKNDKIEFVRGGEKYTEDVLQVTDKGYIVDLFGRKLIPFEDAKIIKPKAFEPVKVEEKKSELPLYISTSIERFRNLGYTDEQLSGLSPVDAGLILRNQTKALKPEKTENKNRNVWEEYKAFRKKAITEEPAKAEDLRKIYNDIVENKDQVLSEITQEINSRKEYQNRRNNTKQEIAQNTYEGMLEKLVHLVTESYMIEGMGESNFRQRKIETMENIIKKATDEEIANLYNEKKTRVANIEKSIKNPITINDYETAKSYRKLTPEENDRFEDLQAIRKKEFSNKSKEANLEKVNIGNLDVIKDKDTRDNSDLWVIKIKDKIPSDQFNELSSNFRKMGGYWSRYKGGFIFKEDPTAKLGGEEKPVASQRNGERLRTVAEGQIDKANEDLNKERLTNTARRARMADSAEADAEKRLSIGQTMLNIADGIDGGDLVLLKDVTSKTQVEELESILNRAKYDRGHKENKRYDEYKNKPPDKEDIRYAEMPKVTLDKGQALSFIEKNPTANVSRELSKRVNSAEQYIKAIKNPAKKVYAEAYNKWIEGGKEKYKEPIVKSGLSHLAQQAVRMNLDKIYEGSQSYIDVTDIAQKLLDKDPELGRVSDQFQNFNRLKRMGIEDDVDLRAALREYLDIRDKGNQSVKEKEIKKMERELIGTKIPGYFPTPKSVVADMLSDAKIEEGMSVLEPSAGKGNIADMVKQSGHKVDTIEWNNTLKQILEKKGHNVVGDDFLAYDKNYDRIIMNPPFEKGQDIEHVKHAYDLLNPGGRIVALMSGSTMSRSDAKAVDFQNWMSKVNGSVEALPEGSFKTSERPTGVNVIKTVIDKPLTEPNRFISEDAYNQAKDNLNKNLGTLKAGIDPSSLKDLFTVGAYHFENGLRDFGKWSKEMIKTYGSQVKEHLKDIWEDIHGKYKDFLGNPFFYNSERKILEKMPENAPIQQVRDILKEVNPEETKWLGLDDYLKQHQGQKINRGDLLNFLKMNELKIEEVKKGGLDNQRKNEEAIDLIRDDLARMNKLDESTERLFEEYAASNYEDTVTRNNISELLNENGLKNYTGYLNQGENRSLESNTKYSQYTLPGGENYRELLFTMPMKVKDNYIVEQIKGRKDFKPELEGKWGVKLEGEDFHVSFDTEQQARAYAKAQGGASNRVRAAFKSPHWEEPNVLAHTRVDDRVDANGKKTLFVEEVQSDWALEGRRKGYKSNLNWKQEGDTYSLEGTNIKIKHEPIKLSFKEFVRKELEQIMYGKKFTDKDIEDFINKNKENSERLYEREKNQYYVYEPDRQLGQTLHSLESAKEIGESYAKKSTVPDMPFKSNWHEFVLKNLLREAAEEGYDQLSWVTGEQTAERYDLSKQVESVLYSKDNSLHVVKKGENAYITIARDIPESKIEDYIGKEPAKKLLEAKPNPNGDRFIKDLDLKIGSKWTENLYDKMIPEFMNKYGKKWGAKVGETQITGNKELKETFNDWLERNGKEVFDNYDAQSPEYKQWLKEGYANKIETVHSFPITPEMKQSVLTEGQPMFGKETTKVIPDKRYEQAKKNVLLKGQNLTAGIDPTLLKDYAVIGEYHLRQMITEGIKKGKEFQEWSKRILEDLAPIAKDLKPYLKNVWDELDKSKLVFGPTKTTSENYIPEFGETKIRGLALSTEARAISKAILDKELETLPTYDVKKNQPAIDYVANAITKNLDKVKAWEFGQEKLPEGLEPGFVHLGLENYATRTGDANLAIELATSPYVMEKATELGRGVQSFRNQDPLSSTKAIKDVIEARRQSSGFKRAQELEEQYKGQIDDLQKQLDLKNKEIEKLNSEQAFKKVKREEGFRARRENRVYTKQELKEERTKLYTDLYKELSTVNVGIPISGKAAKILLDLTRNYAKEGLINAEAVVDAIYNEIKDKIEGITSDDIRNSIAGYGREIKPKSKSELQRAVDDLRKQMTLISKIKDLEAGKVIQKRETAGRTEPSQELKDLRGELQSKMIEYGITEEKNLDLSKRNIRRRIIEYNNKLAKGEYRKEEKISPMDEERAALQRQLEDVRNRWNYVQKTVGELISKEDAKKIADLAKKVSETKEIMDKSKRRGLFEKATKEEQDYGRARVEFGEYVENLRDSANKLTWEDFKDNPTGTILRSFKHVPGVTKSAKATMDNSGLFNQHIKTLWSHPTVWSRNAVKSFQDIVRVWGGRNVLSEISADIVSRPNYPNYIKDKVAVGVIEEAFPDSKLLEKIPFIGSKLHKAADTAFTGLAYRNRVDLYDLYTEIAKNNGHKETTGLGLGKLVNSLTGRGNLGKAERFADTFNVLFFSPRYVKSHIDVLTAHGYVYGKGWLYDKKDPENFARKEAAKNLLKILGGTATVLLTAKAMGANVELDPRSSDFGRIKVGDTRFNVFGGMNSIVTLGTRLMTTLTNLAGVTNMGNMKSSTSGEVYKINSHKFGAQTGWDLLQNFASGKLSPVAGVTRDFLRGETYSGDRISLGGEATNLIAPLPFTNAAELLNDPKSAPFLLGLIADGLGIFTNTYSNDINVRRVKRAILQADEEVFKSKRRMNFFKGVNSALKNGSITESQANSYRQQFKQLQQSIRQ